MRVVDYAVSYSLEINNRALRYLAECDTHGRELVRVEGAEVLPSDMHSVYAESLLAKEVRRLCSMRWLMKPGWQQAGDGARAHVRMLRATSDLLTNATSHHRLALRLASLATQDDDARAILHVARRLTTEALPTWEVMNDLFARDSELWRSCAGFQLMDDAVMAERIRLAYRKGYRLGRDIDTKKVKIDKWLNKDGAKLHKWAQIVAHLMELIRPGMSDKARAQLWYLDKLSDALRMRNGLCGLNDAMRGLDGASDNVDVAGQYVEQQIKKMNNRIVRLAEGSLPIRPKRFGGVVEHAIGALGLHEITFVHGGKESAEGLLAADGASESGFAS